MTNAPSQSAALPITVNWQRPKLYEKQHDALFCDERFSIVEASTKSGKTVGCIVWLLEKAILEGQPGRNYWWIAPVYPQAEIAFQRMKLGCADIPNLIRSINESDLTISLFNGAVIAFKSGEKPDNLYGENVFAAVLDEMTRMREAVWHAIRSTLTATNGPARLIGNVKGKKNWAYRIARRAQLGMLRGWHYGRITAADAVEAGVLDAEEIEGAREELPEAVFKELYEAEASDDEGNPFGMAHIAACMVPLLSNRAVDVLGGDFGKRTDYTVLLGLDRTGAMAHFERFKLDWEMVHVRLGVLAPKARKVMVDSTGVGDPVVERAQRDNGNIEGYHWSASSKQRLMEGLAVAIQQHRIRIYDDPEGVIRGELESFEYEYTRTGVRYSAPDGMHDDVVAALAMAVTAQGFGNDPVYDIEGDLLATRQGSGMRNPLGGPPPDDDGRRNGELFDQPDFGGGGLRLGGF